MLTDPRLRLVAGTELADNDEAVLAALDGVRVVLRVDGAPPSASAAVGLLIGLVARLFAHVHIDGDARAEVSGLTMSASELLERLRWLRPAAVTQPTVDKVIGIGLTGGRPVDLGIGGGAWTARVGREPQPVTQVHGVPLFGVQAAACLAVAELIKETLLPVGFRSRRLDRTLVWDLLSYRIDTATGRVDRQRRVPVEVALAGVGSVGTSVVSTLLAANTPFLSKVVLIDPEDFDDRNPFRYPALLDDITGAGKAQWARQRLADAGVEASAYRGTVAQWVADRPEPGFDGVLVASPDTLTGRRDVTDVLARTTLSVGVAGLAFHVSRHHLGDGLACPYCEYVNTGPLSTQAEVYAVHTGLEVARVLQLMQPGAVLAADDLARVHATGKISMASRAALLGHRLDDLIARAYAEVRVAPAGDAAQVLLAAPYVSALAGVLAAVEIYKINLGLPVVDRRLDLDLSGLPQGYVRRPSADATGRCLCASGFRQAAMRRLYRSMGGPGRVVLQSAPTGGAH
ncbi:ThiF family protein [Lentzea atacamensis]|uniref:ThiF family protein n=1 Tax=Lentzea atacamensis TaxID=531938 RepID=A0A316HWU7_9PSEU|nr:ThiF family adenylyltransferase [Lentzea atacamensis]PWK84593.1 ThiF family protein [Lentzea atacamensis]